MATGHYPGFDVRRIGSDGFPVNPGVQTLNVTNLTAGGSLGTVASDGNGAVVAGSFSPAHPGDVVEFSHGSYTGTFRLTLAANNSAAYETLVAPGTPPQATYILENLYTRTVDSDRVAFYIEDLDHPEIPPQHVGTLNAGTTGFLPCADDVTKNLRIKGISITKEKQRERADFDTTNYQDITVPAGTPRPLFDHYTDATTTGTSEETLYLDLINAGTLARNGDKIIAEYSGVCTSGGNVWRIYFAGTSGFRSDDYDFASLTANSNSDWKLTVTIVRVSSSVVRYTVVFQIFDPDNKYAPPWVRYYEITGLDLDTDYELYISGASGGGAGNITAKMAHGIFWPGVQVIDYLTGGGDFLTGGGEYLTA